MKQITLLVAFSFFVQTVPVRATQKFEFRDAAEERFAEQASWNRFMAQIVAYQPRNVGWKRYSEAIGLSTQTAPGLELARATRNTKSWPNISIVKNALKFDVKGSPTVTLSHIDHQLLLNGVAVHLDLARPLIPQVRDALSKGAVSTGKGHSFSFIPEASAAVSDGAGFGLSFGSFFVGGGASIAAALAVGTAIGFGSGVAVLVGGLAGTFDVAICGMNAAEPVGGVQAGDTWWERFKNCTAAPLSWINKNPRDRLFLSKIDCDYAANGTIRVFLESPSGKYENRQFLAQGGKMRKVLIDGGAMTAQFDVTADGTRIDSVTTNPNSEARGFLRRPKNAKELDSAQGILSDYGTYQALCGDPANLAELRRQIARGHRQAPEERAWDAKDPAQLNRSAQ